MLPSGGFRQREPGVFEKDGRAVEVLARPPADASALDVVVLEQAELARHTRAGPLKASLCAVLPSGGFVGSASPGVFVELLA